MLGPQWECSRCGATGDLETASKLSGGEHLVHLAIALAVVGAIILVLKVFVL